MHQNTTHFTSKAENTQGSIGTTTLVPYSLMQIHGWVNPKVAEKTGLSPADLKLMYEGLWYGTSGDGSSHSRSKVGQNSVLLLEIEYAKTNQKIYGVDRLIKLDPKDDKKGEQLRSMDDYKLDFSKLKPSTAKVTLRLPQMMLEDLRMLANEQDVPYQSLMKIFLSQRIKEEYSQSFKYSR